MIIAVIKSLSLFGIIVVCKKKYDKRREREIIQIEFNNNKFSNKITH